LYSFKELAFFVGVTLVVCGEIVLLEPDLGVGVGVSSSVGSGVILIFIFGFFGYSGNSRIRVAVVLFCCSLSLYPEIITF